MMGVIQRKRVVLNVPTFVMKVMAFGFDMVEAVTMGLVTNKGLTRAPLNSPGTDHRVGTGATGWAGPGRRPCAHIAARHRESPAPWRAEQSC